MAELLSACGRLRGPAKLGSIAPHSVQDHGELARKRRSRLLHAGSFGEAQTPRLERTPFLHAREQNACRLEQISTHHRVAAFGDTPRPVNFAGGVSLGVNPR